MKPILAHLMDDMTAGRVRVVDLTRSMSAADAIQPGEHSRTHFHAPGLSASGQSLPFNTCDTIPPRRFVGPACVIDVSRETANLPGFVLRPDHITAWERENGRIEDGSWVLMRTDWDKVNGSNGNGAPAPAGALSPGFDAATCEFLAKERHIVGVGVETPSIDVVGAASFDPQYPAQAILHSLGKFGLLGLCSLDALPLTGSVLITAPLKIVGGSASLCRAIAMAPA